MINVLLLSLITGCHVPVLTSPQETGEWTAPLNDWPSNPPPDNLEEQGFEDGETALDLQFIDQNGDSVSLWQFYGYTVLIDISSEWCAPCKELANEVEPTQQDYAEQGFIYLTILAEDNTSQLPNEDTLNKWASDHNIETVPVLGPKADYRSTLVPTGAYPRLILLNDKLTVIKSNIQPVEDRTIRAAIESAL